MICQYVEAIKRIRLVYLLIFDFFFRETSHSDIRRLIMEDSERRHVQGHDELNKAFDSGTIFEASTEDLQRYLCALASLNIQSDQVRTKAVVRALTINHVQMARTIGTFESTIRTLDHANGRTQKLVVTLAIVAIAVAALQCLIALGIIK